MTTAERANGSRPQRERQWPFGADVRGSLIEASAAQIGVFCVSRQRSMQSWLALAFHKGLQAGGRA